MKASCLALLLLLPHAVLAADPKVGKTLVFSDEFTALSLDPQANKSGRWATYWVRWGVRNLSGNNDEALKADGSYTGSGGPSLSQHKLTTHQKTNENTLKLFGRIIPETVRPQFWGFPYVAGMISSELSHAQTYGYWEIRARLLTTSQGHHWAIWLLPQDGGWPPEVDILEVVGLDPKKLHMNVHGSPADQLSWYITDKPTSWHTYGFLWDQAQMVWYIDGVERKRHDNFVNEPMYVIVSPEIGNNWAGDPGPSTKWPMEAEIDYVKVYR
jgi:beta-glucanase (GH16 family)